MPELMTVSTGQVSTVGNVVSSTLIVKLIVSDTPKLFPNNKRTGWLPTSRNPMTSSILSKVDGKLLVGPVEN